MREPGNHDKEASDVWALTAYKNMTTTTTRHKSDKFKLNNNNEIILFMTVRPARIGKGKKYA